MKLAHLFEEPEVKNAIEAAQVRAHEQMNELTPREREVAVLMADGLPNKIIAYRLGLSIRTVENHRIQIMQKAGVSSYASLVKLVILAG